MTPVKPQNVSMTSANRKKFFSNQIFICFENFLVRAISVYYGRTQILSLSKSESHEPIDTKVCSIDYVGEMSGCAKNYFNRLHGAPPHIGEIYDVFVCLRSQVREQSQQRDTQRSMMAQNTCFPCRKYLLGVPVMASVRKGRNTQKTPNFAPKAEFLA